MNNNNLRTIVRGAYDIQKLRIMMGNRIVAQFKAKLGQKPGESEDEIDEDGQQVLKDLREDFRLMMDGVKGVKLATFKASPLISSFTEFVLLQQFMELEESEKRHFANLAKILLEYPVFTGYLQEVKGIGPAMAGVIVSEIDISKVKYVSSLWAYAGIDVAADGAGRSRRKEHLVEREYIDRDGQPAKRMGITFNPFLKTKLMGVLAASFLRVGENPFSKIYNDYKHRLESSPKWADRSKGHRHNAAMRYMIKMFLMELYVKWKEIEGLPAMPPIQASQGLPARPAIDGRPARPAIAPYHEDKLGLKHSSSGEGR